VVVHVCKRVSVVLPVTDVVLYYVQRGRRGHCDGCLNVECFVFLVVVVECLFMLVQMSWGMIFISGYCIFSSSRFR
jgi:hypothetical protein